MLLLISVALAFLAASTGARLVPDTSSKSPRHDLKGSFRWTSISTNDILDSSSVITTAAANDDVWAISVARGTKLLSGMRSSDASAAALYNLGTTAESPFDGDLHTKLEEWGYADNTPAMQKLHDPECNMASATGHMLSKAFADLGMQTASKGKGGPNTCFQIEHFDGPATIRNEDGSLPEKKEQYYMNCGTKYRVTGAEHTIGVNAASGAIFALNRKGAAKAAQGLWRKKPQVKELPHIRSSSDISWALWVRAVRNTPGARPQDIKYLCNMMIINKETNQLIKRAMQTLTSPLEGPIGWPGHDFSMDTEAGKALLGSPVGRWAGYFLMQHKRQLGGDKYIEKVRVFKSEKEGSWPYFVFYVAGFESTGSVMKGEELKDSKLAKGPARVHRGSRAKL